VYHERWKQIVDRGGRRQTDRLGTAHWWAKRSSWRPARAVVIRHDVRMGRRELDSSDAHPLGQPVPITTTSLHPQAAPPQGVQTPVVQTPEVQGVRSQTRLHARMVRASRVASTR